MRSPSIRKNLSKKAATISFIVGFFFLAVVTGKISFENPDTQNNLQVAFQIIFFVYILILKIISPDLFYFIFPIKRFAYVFIFLFIIVGILRPNIYISLRNTAACVISVINIIGFSSFLHRISFKSAIKLIFICFILLLSLNLIMHFQYKGFIGLEIDRSIGSQRLNGYYGGGLAGIMAGFTIILAFIAWHFKIYKRIFILLICNLISWIVMILSDNRTGMLITSILSLILIYSIGKNRKYTIVVLLLSITIISIFFIYYYNNNLGKGNLQEDSSLRVDIWGLSINRMSKSILLGFGAEKYSYIETSIYDRFNDAHNAYLTLILQSGILVFFIFLIINIKILKITYYYCKKSKTNLYPLFIIPIYWYSVALTGGTYFSFNGAIDSYIYAIPVVGLLLHPGISKIK